MEGVGLAGGGDVVAGFSNSARGVNTGYSVTGLGMVNYRERHVDQLRLVCNWVTDFSGGYGYNGQQKDDEISGPGNHNTAEFWEYDTRLGRRWNRDPVVKPWESPYATFANSPNLNSDYLGLDVVNAHKANKEKAETRMNAAKDNLAKLSKGDAGFGKARKELRSATREFESENGKFLRVESKINEIKMKDPNLFNTADRLKDAGGTKVDILVYDTPEEVMQVGVGSGTKLGDTRAWGGSIMRNADDNTEYQEVMTIRPGNENKPDGQRTEANLVVIRISDIAQAIHLAHEFGHSIYQVQNMRQYEQWRDRNPSQRNLGGHGKDDPSGKAAEAAESKFK